MIRRSRDAIAAACLFGTLAIVMTWPLAWRLTTLAPQHHDVYFNMWRLRWIAHALAAGRRVGAVREDLPESLLIAVTLGMGEAMDTWLLARQPDDGELPEVIAAIVGMLRRAVAP